jgi:predicted ATPase
VLHLLSVSWKKPPPAAARERFPYSVPAIRDLDEIEFRSPVTFFVGENGSGKSTLLEGIAAAADLPALGSDMDVARDATLGAQRELGERLRLAWGEGRWSRSPRSRRGFYLRAEDFFGHLKFLAKNRARIDRERREAAELGARRDSQIEPVDDRVDEAASAQYLGLYDARSHGESFLELFENRVTDGLYLLDEPEAPLSAQRQLTLITQIAAAVEDGAQFVIATHSPILLAFPGATIYAFGEGAPRVVPYEELEHVRLTRDFLNAPGRYLRHIVQE